MEKLIKNQRRSYWSLVNTALKRAAVIILSLITMFAASFSVKAIREPVVNFFTEVYQSFTRYFFKGGTADVITKEYVLAALPDGFEQTNKIQSDISITTIFENASGDVIEFTQIVTDKTQLNLDNENGMRYEISVGGKAVHVLEADGLIQAIWIEKQYCFLVTGYGEIDVETIKQLIDNTK